MKKKSRKFRMIFDIENWLLKSDLALFDDPCEHLWKSNQKIFFFLLIFLLKSSPCWLMSAKLHHWGHTKGHFRWYIEDKDYQISEKKDQPAPRVLPLSHKSILLYVRGHSLATLTRFWPFLTTYPLVTERTFSLVKLFDQTSTVWFGPNDRTFFLITFNANSILSHVPSVIIGL